MALVLNSSSISGLAAVGGLSSPQTGSVLQVVQTSYASYLSTSSGSLVTTNLTASITPSATSSKIWVLINANLDITNAGSGLASMQLQIVRGSTALLYQDRGLALNSGTSGTFISAPTCLSYLDSPATTSSTTYTLQFAGNGVSAVRMNDYNTIPSTVGSTMTLLEIAA